jgi:hypothetical protein
MLTSTRFDNLNDQYSLRENEQIAFIIRINDLAKLIQLDYVSEEVNQLLDTIPYGSNYYSSYNSDVKINIQQNSIVQSVYKNTFSTLKDYTMLNNLNNTCYVVLTINQFKNYTKLCDKENFRYYKCLYNPSESGKFNIIISIPDLKQLLYSISPLCKQLLKTIPLQSNFIIDNNEYKITEYHRTSHDLEFYANLCGIFRSYNVKISPEQHKTLLNIMNADPKINIHVNKVLCNPVMILQADQCCVLS